jgi:maltooligosyltrehalose trehalohydrolase
MMRATLMHDRPGSIPSRAEGRDPSEAPVLDHAQGAKVVDAGVRYRIWAEHDNGKVVVYGPDGTIARTLNLQPEADGFFSVLDASGRSGDRYKYRFGDGDPLPDPASRFQPDGVHGPGLVIDPSHFAWSDSGWKHPSLGSLVIYELHIGAFTHAGTFAAAAAKLEELSDLGINAIEIMPIADFPGERNWGYDGVSLYAPARVYGTPNDLRRLVDVAHAHNIAVVLDVVYNHFGPDGNYLSAYNRRYFNTRHNTAWGAAVDFELRPVREFFLHNIVYWAQDFHIDGFRLDATHALQDRSAVHILEEIAEMAHGCDCFVVAEDERNDPQLLGPRAAGGLGLDGCWADDFHHVLHVGLTGERDAYYRNFDGTAGELAMTLKNGWLFTGQTQATTGDPRGGDPSDLSPEQFIFCISNHDQVGNRAFGERLNQLVSPAAFRAASALLLLAPYTPLLFMGQEWAASTPFQYFTDHEPDLGAKVTAGRRREFRGFAAFRDPGLTEQIPSPQAETTFLNSKLDWSERGAVPGAQMVALYRECIELRRRLPGLQDRSRANWRVAELNDRAVAIIYGFATGDYVAVVTELQGDGLTDDELTRMLRPGGKWWTEIFSSDDGRLGGESSDGTAPRTRLLQAAE